MADEQTSPAQDTSGAAGAEDLTAADEGRFSAQPTAETPTGYIANFSGDEINGRVYKVGDRIADDVDAGTLAFLVQNGRITPTTADAAGSPAGGEGGTGTPDANDAETDPAVTELVDGNTKEALLKIAEDEKVEGVTADNNKTEIATKIVEARKNA
jgi:hypothetical protein